MTSNQAIPAPETDDWVPSPQDMVAADFIEKVNAGAALVHALYHLPAATLAALLDNTGPAFRAIYDHAQVAYGFEGTE